MTIYKLRRYLYHTFNNVILYLRYKYYINQNSITSANNIIVFSYQDIFIYHRYLYCLIKWFLIEENQVCFHRGFHTYKALKESNPFLALLIKNKEIKFIPQDFNFSNVNYLTNRLSPDYFNTKEHFSQSFFKIPMCQYPIMYSEGYWNEPITIPSRKQTIFAIGNFNPIHYNKLHYIFENTISRRKIYDFLNQKNLVKKISNKESFFDYLKSKNEFDTIIIDRKYFSFKQSEIRNILGHFDFFLACPGVTIPLCHNLVEALSVGCIPLIQDEYAKLLSPPLVHLKNAIIFKNLEDLETKIYTTLNLNQDKIIKMHQEIQLYYLENLTPNSVVKRINANRDSILYLQGEGNSI